MHWRRKVGFASGLLAVGISLFAGCGRSNRGAGSGDDAASGAGGDSSVGSEGGAGASNGGASAYEPTLSEAIEAMLEAHCQRLQRCGGWTEYDQVPGGCVAALRVSWKSIIEELEPALSSGRFAYDARAAAACVEARRNQRCDDPLSGFPSFCLRALDGTVALGEECGSNDECAGFAYCRGCPGRCESRAAPGEPCGAERPCEFGSSCRSGTCVASAREGEPCNHLSETGAICAGYQTCAGSTAEEPGRCEPYRIAKAGEPCDAEGTIRCEVGSACVTVMRPEEVPAQRCVERSELDGRCWNVRQDSCPVGQYCPLSWGAPDQGALSTRCLPLARDGERCYAPHACTAGAICLAEVCVRQQPLGEACSRSLECLSGQCVDRRCSRPSVCAPADDAPSSRDPEPPAPGCPTEVAGHLLGDFDTAILDWQTYPPTGEHSLSRTDEALACSGALQLRVKLSESTPIVNVFRPVGEDGSWDSSWQRVHFWVRLGTPESAEALDDVQVQAFVARQRGTNEEWVDASLFGDGRWHELVVPVHPEESAEVLNIGVSVYAEPQLADAVPELELSLDAVWAE